jgi:hypothetical protein
MAPTTEAYAEKVGRAYAEAARGNPDVLELWVSAVPGNVHVWMITPPLDTATERDLHRLSGAVYDHFGKADFQLHTLNPRHFRGDVRLVVPRDAVQIPLHTA